MKTAYKTLIVVLLVAAIAGTLALKQHPPDAAVAGEDAAARATGAPGEATGLPRLVDLGADQCVPCKMMAPILADLKEAYAGRFQVEFIDVWKNEEAAATYGVQVIPTQIFYAANGKELHRHTGFIGREAILATWKDLGVDLGPGPAPAFSRWQPAQPDTRSRERICYLCDGDIPAETRTILTTPAGDVPFCSVHCYVITYASMTDATKSHDDAATTDAASGSLVPVTAATYLYGLDTSGRPAIRGFASEGAARDAQQQAGGNVLNWPSLETRETAIRCGFCDRPVYAEDASLVRAGGMQTWGCCVMCALGVAARTGQDIEVEANDALTGEPVRVRTFEGHIAALEPDSAVAWGGAFKDAQGNVKSAGCFKQAFFTSPENLRTWVEKHPAATGRQLSMEEALAAKMKLTPEQISKACKIGECAPK